MIDEPSPARITVLDAAAHPGRKGSRFAGDGRNLRLAVLVALAVVLLGERLTLFASVRPRDLVPVAPAIRPCRFVIASGSRTIASWWSSPSWTPGACPIKRTGDATAAPVTTRDTSTAPSARPVGPRRGAPSERAQVAPRHRG